MSSDTGLRLALTAIIAFVLGFAAVYVYVTYINPGGPVSDPCGPLHVTICV